MAGVETSSQQEECRDSPYTSALRHTSSHMLRVNQYLVLDHCQHSPLLVVYNQELLKIKTCFNFKIYSHCIVKKVTYIREVKH